MMPSRLSGALMIAAAAIALSACADDYSQRNTAQYNDDTTINTNAQTAVIGVPGVHAKTMQVSTYDGVVTLRRTVDNQLAGQTAIQAARPVAGGK